MRGTVNDLHRAICVAAGINDRPDWLQKRRDIDWLEQCYRLVTAGVVEIGSSGPEVCRVVPASEMSRYIVDIAGLLSE